MIRIHEQDGAEDAFTVLNFNTDPILRGWGGSEMETEPNAGIGELL